MFTSPAVEWTQCFWCRCYFQ